MLIPDTPLDALADVARSLRLCERRGTVSGVTGLIVEIANLRCSIGEEVIIHGAQLPVSAQVVGFQNGRSLALPLGDIRGISSGCSVTATGHTAQVVVSDSLLGRVVDGLGHALDGGIPITGRPMPIEGVGVSAHPLRRLPISETLTTGVRVVDGLLTCGRGQRLGIFAGSGVGKSTFLGMIARNSDADVNVIALIGERGREVQDFITHNLGPAGMARSVIVVATSDQPALIRRNAAWVAATIAAYFRDTGHNVLFMMDSVTRFAMAQREVGLAAGEPPATRGYTPSVFAMLPLLLERSGTGEVGTITGFYTVLVEGDDMNEPITDAVRGILDGHIVLSRDLAAANHYPAVDTLASVSRLMPRLASVAHRQSAGRLRGLLAAHAGARDLLEIGAYVDGSNPEVDAAVERMDDIKSFLCQDIDDVTSFPQTLRTLEVLAA